MENKIIKGFVGLFIAVLGYVAGAINELFAVLAILIVLDYILGIVNALIKGEFSVKKGLIGTVKKATYLALMLIGFLLDFLITYLSETVGMNIQTKGIFGYAITCYLIGNEGISCLQTITELGLPVPNFLKKAFGVIKDTAEKETEK